MTTMQADVTGLIGADVVDTDGDGVGTVGQVFLDDQTGAPTWVRIRIGRFGGKDRFVPLAGSHRSEWGLAVPYKKQDIKDAPAVDASSHLSAVQADELRRYYGMMRVNAGPGQEDLMHPAAGGEPINGRHRPDDGRLGYDEGLRVLGGSPNRNAEAGHRAATEEAPAPQRSAHATVRPELTIEGLNVSADDHVEIQRVPITDEERAAGVQVGEHGDDEHEIIVHEERVVVRKETIPVERVRVRIRRRDDAAPTAHDQAAKEPSRRTWPESGVRIRPSDEPL